MDTLKKCCTSSQIIVNGRCTVAPAIKPAAVIAPTCPYSINFSGACCGIYQQLDAGRNCVDICLGGARKDDKGNCCDSTGLQIIKDGCCFTVVIPVVVPAAVVALVPCVYSTNASGACCGQFQELDANKMCYTPSTPVAYQRPAVAYQTPVVSPASVYGYTQVSQQLSGASIVSVMFGSCVIAVILAFSL